MRIFGIDTRPVLLLLKTVNAVVAEAAGFRRDRGIFGHSSRCQAAEKVFYAGLAVKDIMAAAEWKSELVFPQPLSILRLVVLS